MKKRVLILFLLLSCSKSLYPLALTKKDHAVIGAIRFSFMSAAIIGGVLGLKKYLPSSHWWTSTPAENLAETAFMQADLKKWFRYSFIPNIFRVIAITAIPTFIGMKLGDRLSALYLVRKYGISYTEALKFIQNYPFDDELYKKGMVRYLNA